MANTMKAAVFEKVEMMKVQGSAGAGDRRQRGPDQGEDTRGSAERTGASTTGWYSADKLPMIPGHEFSGVIARVGKNAGKSEGRGPRHGGHQHELRNLLLLPPRRETAL